MNLFEIGWEREKEKIENVKFIEGKKKQMKNIDI